MNQIQLTVGLSVLLASTSALRADLVNYNLNFDGWKAAVNNNFTTCDFTGIAKGFIVGDEYADLGVLMSSSTGTMSVNYIPPFFPEDDWGVQPYGYIEFTFTEQLMIGFGAHVPGHPEIQLFLGDQLVGVGLPAPGAGPKFKGLTSSTPFDRVRLIPGSFLGTSNVDNFYFAAVPAPSVFAVLVMSAGVRSRRRRSGSTRVD